MNFIKFLFKFLATEKSDNEALNRFILERDLKWYPFNKFRNVEYLDKGGFGTVYKAILLDGNKEMVLKHNDTLNENLEEFLKEWKFHESCLDSPEIINLYGFTKNPGTSSYMVVMDYANKGNLRGNLTTIVKNSWKKRLHILYKIISGLNEVHDRKLIHCDFHDGNILYHENKNNEGNKENVVGRIYISDLGLCQPSKYSLKKEDVFGVVPFMAPEVLRGKPYTQASDIYSFSMIMWEFTSGVTPFKDKAHDFQLSLSICKGERPEIIEGTPQCYVDLMKKCWDDVPSKRPTALVVKNIIKNWISLPNETNIQDINEELTNDITEFINAPVGHEHITETHPEACYTSRLHDFNSGKLNEIIESECLGCLVEEVEDSLDVIETDDIY
ncbi:hypothetical protein RclHR1_06860003 [Rhizophagus clarus]|uniref:Kinase-like domain-containing protein n=1 Tax=Rhizophagus clarus TaxID=94130 RepID=A0A2Z6RTX3_9GLOM|nr:hypothetical protein RclHR1_06860003 [Rhizophagus clarus]GES88105.1 kinase-like domain-containing protein [Rhizophagus clarus]